MVDKEVLRGLAEGVVRRALNDGWIVCKTAAYPDGELGDVVAWSYGDMIKIKKNKWSCQSIVMDENLITFRRFFRSRDVFGQFDKLYEDACAHFNKKLVQESANEDDVTVGWLKKFWRQP